MKNSRIILIDAMPRRPDGTYANELHQTWKDSALFALGLSNDD